MNISAFKLTVEDMLATAKSNGTLREVYKDLERAYSASLINNIRDQVEGAEILNIDSPIFMDEADAFMSGLEKLGIDSFTYSLASCDTLKHFDVFIKHGFNMKGMSELKTKFGEVKKAAVFVRA